MITQQILSRTRLERIIQEFNLYAAERSMLMEDLIERMRRDIEILIARQQRDDEQVNSFSVAFQGTDPRMTMRVTERLASLLVQENIEDRALLADQTDQFLKVQIEDLRRRLLEAERTLFKVGRRDVRLPVLIAEHDVLMETYKQVLAHSEASNLAVNLERRLSGGAAGLVASLLLFVWRRGRPARITATA